MTKRVNTDAYLDFVDAVTSKESNDYIAFNSRCFEIQKGDDGIPINRLITAALGMSAESGEFTEVVKKIVFQGKPYTEENRFHMKRELGDVMWYVAQCCIALDISLDDICDMNIEKLGKRFPDGHFDTYYSENRKANDL